MSLKNEIISIIVPRRYSDDGDFCKKLRERILSVIWNLYNSFRFKGTSINSIFQRWFQTFSSNQLC